MKAEQAWERARDLAFTTAVDLTSGAWFVLFPNTLPPAYPPFAIPPHSTASHTSLQNSPQAYLLWWVLMGLLAHRRPLQPPCWQVCSMRWQRLLYVSHKAASAGTMLTIQAEEGLGFGNEWMNRSCLIDMRSWHEDTAKCHALCVKLPARRLLNKRKTNEQKMLSWIREKFLHTLKLSYFQKDIIFYYLC